VKDIGGKRHERRARRVHVRERDLEAQDGRAVGPGPDEQHAGPEGGVARGEGDVDACGAEVFEAGALGGGGGVSFCF
jgi:hypothetical protein